jgi:exopolysaccharide production protein ExoZ
MKPSTTYRYEGIQALRFVAALLVVITHATFYVSERLVPGYPVWSSGAAGVDIFFVISGFVMALSSQSLIGRPDGARTFMLRRLSRIVPLYWFATTLKLAAIIAVPATVLNGGLDVGHIVKSYLFLPSYNESGGLHPVVAVGWTLNFEMFFYVVFALAMVLRVPPLPFVGVLFAGLSVAALFRQPDWPAVAFWLDTILLEFVAGMVIARLCLAGVRVPPAIAAAMTAVGFAGLLWPWGAVPDMMRVLVWGIPAALIVAGIAQLEPVLQGRVPAPLMLLGDSSYALYLFHPMIAPAAPALLAKVAFPNVPLSILLSIALAIGSALVVYRFGERPVTAMLKGAVGSRSRLKPA